jgi:FKBP12-rapamycin complex-associated protein
VEGEKSHAEKPKQKGEISLQDISPSSEEYYPTVAFLSLIKILKDPSLSSVYIYFFVKADSLLTHACDGPQYHTRVIEGLVLLFRAAGQSCVPFLPQVLSPVCFLYHDRVCLY